MNDSLDLDETSRDLSRRSLVTMLWLAGAIVGAIVSVFTLPRGVVGLFVIGTDHGTSIILAIVGAAVTALTLFLIWKWARSLRAQRSMERDLDGQVAEAAGIVEMDETDEGLTPQQS